MKLIKMKTLKWLVVIFVCGIVLTFAGCGVTKTVEEGNKEKKECCSKEH
ncbi:hypothetical protein N9322_01595 [bacterium]|jgi:hypothetical protein|nr:hypothetical protein [bacterium]|tara:strand:- start:2799 stop:2945 length:147 start_codon:yes stop_codon:yes gene_type:complete